MRRGILIGLFLGALIYFFGPGLGLWEKDAPADTATTAKTTTDPAAASQAQGGAAPGGRAGTQPTQSADTKATATKTAAEKPTPKKETQEKRAATPLVGRVESVTRPASLTGPMGTVQGPFALVKLTLANRGSSSLDIVSFNIRLIDTDGNSYAVSTDGMGVLFHNRVETFHMETISPGMQMTASVVFAVPAGATPAKIQVRPHGLNQPTTEIKI